MKINSYTKDGKPVKKIPVELQIEIIESLTGRKVIREETERHNKTTL